MAVKTWVQEGKTFFQIDITSRSKVDRNLRIQKRKSGCIESTDLEIVRKKLNRIEVTLAEEARDEVRLKEGAGILWGDLVARWCKDLEQNLREEQTSLAKPVSKTTALGYIQSVVDFTTDLNNKAEVIANWTRIPAQEITPADVEMLFKKMSRIGYSNCRQYNVKVAVSQCFRFGIMNRLIKGVSVSPTNGFGISRKKSKRPEILNADQVGTLLEEAKIRNHPWRTIWEGVVHTGTRAGEAYELRAKDVDLKDRRLFLERKYNFLTKDIEPLKDGEWREVPINDDLCELFMELGVDKMPPEAHVFPRLVSWKNNEQARILRAFCEEIGIPSICFHTLRACWATLLLRNKVDTLTIMKMGGWSDFESMDSYIRTAGLEVEGATQSLSFRKRERPGRVLKLLNGGTV